MVVAPREVPTVAEFADKFLTQAKTNNKRSSAASKEQLFRTHLLPMFGAKRLTDIGPDDIEAFKAAKLVEKKSPKTINNALSVLSRLLSLALEWEVIDRMPKMLLAQNTGLRRGELLALRWEDVDLVAGRLVVRRNVWRKHVDTPKSGRVREVPLNETVLTALKAHRHLRGPLVLCKDDGSQLSAEMAEVAVTRVSRKAGLRKIGWHTLRHTFASHLVMRGVPLKAVQELLGHATIEMTMRYAHLSPDVRKDAVRVLDAVAHPTGSQENAVT